MAKRQIGATSGSNSGTDIARAGHATAERRRVDEEMKSEAEFRGFLEMTPDAQLGLYWLVLNEPPPRPGERV